MMGLIKRIRLGAIALLSISTVTFAQIEPPQFVFQWGSLGAAPGQFSGPHGIEVDTDGNVYVGDTGNHRVQKFTSQGIFIQQWGSLGSATGQLTILMASAWTPRATCS